MVDVSARSQRPTAPVRVLDDLSVLDPEATLSFGDWFSCPELAGQRTGPFAAIPAEDLTGPIPAIRADGEVDDAPTGPLRIVEAEPQVLVPESQVVAATEPDVVATEPEFVAAAPEFTAPEFTAPEFAAPEFIAPGSDFDSAEPEVVEAWRRPAASRSTVGGVGPATVEVRPAVVGPTSAPVTSAPVTAAPATSTPAASSTPVWIEPTAPTADVPAPRSGRSAAVCRPLARATVLAVLLALLGGGATALAMDKKVTVTVDGQERVLHTYATDVAGALASAGFTPAPQDRVEPALPTDVADGDEIILNRARKLTLVEGGGERSVWTTAASVEDALRGLGVQAAPIQMSASPEAAIPLAGMSLELRVPRSVSLADGTGTPQKITTTASTVASLLAERDIELGPDDVSSPPGDAPLTDGASVQVVRNGVGEVVEVRPIAPPEKVVEDPKMPRGKKVVVEKGKPGEQTAIMRVQVQNGREVRREQVRAGGSTAPQPRVVKLGTNDELAAKEEEDGDKTDDPYADENDPTGSTVAPKVSGGAVWDKLAKCEATGNWSVDSGNGYYGGLQFDAGTWRAYGGDEFASLPHKASRAEQIAVATKVRNDRGGYGAWPACSRKLGLPQ